MEASANKDVVILNPNQDILKTFFEDVIHKAIQRICSKHKQMAKMEDFLDFLKFDEQNLDDPIDLK